MKRLQDNYAELAGLLKRYLLCLCHDESLAEDLMQETFYKSIKNIESFDGSCRFSTWMCQIAKNVYFDWYRKQRGKNVEIDKLAAVLISPQDTPEEGFRKKQGLINLLKLLEKLKEPMKEIVLLRVFQDMSFKEIGEIYGKSENWARVSYYRARKELQERIRENEDKM